MSPIVLLQPAPGGRISGGYLYNERMAAHGAWQLKNLDGGAFASLQHELPEDALVLMDSIWLTERDVACFFDLESRGRRVGVMLHSFPSMILAAEAGEPLVTRPTPFEVAALERFGWLVTLGEHYPTMLVGHPIQVVLAPPGVDAAWRGAPRPRAERCSIVSVGSVTPRKGFLDAARVLSARGRDDFEWHVVGSLDRDAAYAHSVRQAAAGLSNVHFWGQLPPEQTREIVMKADVLLMPSYDENHPLSLVEALAASVPPVAYAAGATSSIVGHERCGLVVPIGDVAGLRACLDRVIGDEGLRLHLARGCFARQAELPSWHEAAEQARAGLAGVL